MKTNTIRLLNQLNQRFYLIVADEFDRTRTTFWQGWESIIPHLAANTGHSLSVLDVGCGNGRFGQFLVQHFPDLTIKYTGVDSSIALLKSAEIKLQVTTLQPQLIELDLVEHLLSKQILLEKQLFDLVVAFGIFHHVPAFDLRSKLLQQLANLVSPNGILCIGFWQFLNSTKLRERLVDPKTLGLDNTDWEKNDYILDWRAGESPAYRYCHYTNSQEEIALLKQTELKIIDEFFADGATNKLNHYLMLRK